MWCRNVDPLHHRSPITEKEMKTFKDMLNERAEGIRPIHKNKNNQPQNDQWIRLGGGFFMACGIKKAQSYKGWVTVTEDIPKGTKIHCNLYDQSNGVSMTLATPKNKKL